MTPTPEQLTALNEAIAEYDDYIYMTESWTKLGEECTYPDYTDDLNAIVAVVQDWCKTNKKHFSITFLRKRFDVEIHESDQDTIISDDLDESPALALCIAFARATQMEGWWNE